MRNLFTRSMKYTHSLRGNHSFVETCLSDACSFVMGEIIYRKHAVYSFRVETLFIGSMKYSHSLRGIC